MRRKKGGRSQKRTVPGEGAGAADGAQWWVPQISDTVSHTKSVLVAYRLLALGRVEWTPMDDDTRDRLLRLSQRLYFGRRSPRMENAWCVVHMEGTARHGGRRWWTVVGGTWKMQPLFTDRTLAARRRSPRRLAIRFLSLFFYHY